MYSIAILASPHMVCMHAATAFSTDRDFYDGDLVILIGQLVVPSELKPILCCLFPGLNVEKNNEMHVECFEP